MTFKGLIDAILASPSIEVTGWSVGRRQSAVVQITDCYSDTLPFSGLQAQRGVHLDAKGQGWETLEIATQLPDGRPIKLIASDYQEKRAKVHIFDYNRARPPEASLFLLPKVVFRTPKAQNSPIVRLVLLPVSEVVT